MITVDDRGFCSEDNLRVLQKTGGHYIASEKMTSGKPTVEALAHPGRFKTIRDNLEVKEIVIGEARTRYVLVRNPEEVKRDAARREEHLKRLRVELVRLKELNGDAHTKAHCRLHSHPTYKRYLKIDKRGNLRVDLDAVKYRLDAGKLCQRTELTEEHRAIVSALKIEESQQIWDISLLLPLKPEAPHGVIHNRRKPCTDWLRGGLCIYGLSKPG